MPISVVFIILAMFLYTSSIFTERHMGHLAIWLVVLFGCGFLSDLLGTFLMFISAKMKLSLAFHAICGYSALLIMFCHLVWAILAIFNVGNCQQYFTRFSIYAWIAWMVAFVSGVPKVSSWILNWFS